MPVIYRPFVEKLGGSTSASQFIGNSGELFYDPATTTLRISDGSTPGGTVVSSGSSANTGAWTFTAEDGYNARTDADIVIQAVGAGNFAGMYWNVDPANAASNSSTLVVQSTGLTVQNFDGTDVYALSFDTAGTLTTAGDISMNGSMRGVARIQPENNSMVEITLPLDANANTTPLTLYSEGEAGIAITGGLVLTPVTVTGDSTPANATIPTTLSIAMLDVPDPSAAQFYLPDGHEGQILHLIPVSGATGDAALISLSIDNYRHINGVGTAVVESTSVSGNNFYPFSAAYTTGMVTMVFASGAWQASQGQWT